MAVCTCLVQGRMMYLVPAVKEHHEVTVTFQLPCLRDEYTSKPDHYISHLVGHEGPGSLLSALKVGVHLVLKCNLFTAWDLMYQIVYILFVPRTLLDLLVDVLDCPTSPTVSAVHKLPACRWTAVCCHYPTAGSILMSDF